MEEIFYFESTELVVRVIYNDQMNSLRYISHREMDMTEKLAVEHYILNQIGPHTGYFHRYPSILVYVGVDEKLGKEFNINKLQKTVKKVLVTKEKIDVEIQELINSSLSDYYFDKIGDKILKLRKEIESGSRDNLDKILSNISELVEAYNFHSKRKVTLDKVIPRELKLCC